MSFIKIIRILTAILSILGILFGVLIMSGSEGQIDNMLYLTYIVFLTIVVFVAVFTLKNTFSNPHTLKRTLTSLGLFALVALICYFGLSNGVETPLRDGEVLSANGSKLVGAGLYMFYALVLIAVGTMMFFGIKRMTK